MLACFLPRNVNNLIELNDIKKRADCKDAKVTNPLKDFWMNISNAVNDGEDEQMAALLHNKETKDPHIVGFEVNLANFNIQTHGTCETHITNPLKCQQKLLKKKTSSGNHTNNSWGCVCGEVPKPTKLIDKPKEAIHCLDKHCSKHPDINKGFC